MSVAAHSAALAALAASVAAGAIPAAAHAGPNDAPIQTAHDLLVALERADDNISSLQADILYDRRFELQGDRHVRQGRLLYRVFPAEPPGATPRRVFEIRFDTLYLPLQNRKEDDEQVWVFDGRWLIEKRPAEKRFHAREIAPANAKFDPLRIGEGPFPVPIGQRADDILARFDAKLLDADELFEESENWRRFVADTYRLRLTPKPGVDEREEFRDVQIWYSRQTLLPRLARTVNRQGDVSYVQMINVKTNEPMPADAFDVSAPDPSQGWEVQVDRLDRAASDDKGQRK